MYENQNLTNLFLFDNFFFFCQTIMKTIAPNFVYRIVFKYLSFFTDSFIALQLNVILFNSIFNDYEIALNTLCIKKIKRNKKSPFNSQYFQYSNVY